MTRPGGCCHIRVAVAATLLIAVLGGCAADPPDGPGAAPDGADVYAERCASCHGATLEGTTTGPPLLDERYSAPAYADESMVTAITDGAEQRNWDFGAMPMVNGLSDAEVAAVIDHVRAVQRSAQ
jgi:mono/diheme cytochrome c family protein